MKNKFHAGLLIVTCILFAYGLFVATELTYRILTVPENHVSYDIRGDYVTFGALTGSSLLPAAFRKMYTFIFIALFAIAAQCEIYYTDKHNLVIQYEEWIKRGMPDKGEPSSPRDPSMRQSGNVRQGKAAH